jgi:hypothetical protein
MFIPDPLFEASQHRRQLQADAAAERLRPRLTRHLLAEALRATANRLDARPVVRPPTWSPQ